MHDKPNDVCHPCFDGCDGIAKSGNVITVRFHRNYTQAVHHERRMHGNRIEIHLARKVFHWQTLCTASKCVSGELSMPCEQHSPSNDNARDLCALCSMSDYTVKRHRRCAYDKNRQFEGWNVVNPASKLTKKVFRSCAHKHISRSASDWNKEN